MKKKWWIMLAVSLGCMGLAVAFVALRPPRPGVTKENFDRIEAGMTYGEVVAILGPPNAAERARRKYWANESADVEIFFDEDLRVEAKYLDEYLDDRTAFEKLVDQLPWREKRPRRKLEQLRC